MTYIETVPPERASGAVAEHYEADRANFGHLPNLSLEPGLRDALTVRRPIAER